MRNPAENRKGDQWVEFRNSPIHGIGGFAVRQIALGTRVIEYVGEKISKGESQRRCELGNSFIFYWSSELDLDGAVTSNPARWLNHSCTPNCEVRMIEGELWVVAMRAIEVGEEITFNYGYDFEWYREHPCHCGSSRCIGYILAEEHHELIRKYRVNRGS